MLNVNVNFAKQWYDRIFIRFYESDSDYHLGKPSYENTQGSKKAIMRELIDKEVMSSDMVIVLENICNIFEIDVIKNCSTVYIKMSNDLNRIYSFFCSKDLMIILQNA